MKTSYFLKRDDRVHGPFSLTKMRQGIAEKKIVLSDLIGKTLDGPWTPLNQTKLRNLFQDESIHGHVLDYKCDAQESLVAELIEVEESPLTASATSEPAIHQLDETEFLITGYSKGDVYNRLLDAVERNHSVTGAFEKSRKIRGAGVSGFTFSIVTRDHDEGIAIMIDGESPNGPINFEAWFNPTTVGGWGLFAATEVFNNAINKIATNKLEQDVRLLLANVYFSFGVVTNDFASIRSDDYTFETSVNTEKISSFLMKFMGIEDHGENGDTQLLLSEGLLPLGNIRLNHAPTGHKGIHPEDFYILGDRGKFRNKPKFTLIIGVGETDSGRSIVICTVKPKNLLMGLEGRSFYTETAKQYSRVIESLIRSFLKTKIIKSL